MVISTHAHNHRCRRRVIIPKEVRDALALKPGQSVDIGVLVAAASGWHEVHEPAHHELIGRPAVTGHALAEAFNGGPPEQLRPNH